MAKPFVPVLMDWNGEGKSQMVSAYDRANEENPKDGFRLLGKVIINGIAHQINGFASPITGSSKPKGRKPAPAQASV